MNANVKKQPKRITSVRLRIGTPIYADLNRLSKKLLLFPWENVESICVIRVDPCPI